MCPIDPPGTYIDCHGLSRREYLLFEVGDGVRYINITDSLVSFDFTAISIAPLGEEVVYRGDTSGSPMRVRRLHQRELHRHGVLSRGRADWKAPSSSSGCPFLACSGTSRLVDLCENNQRGLCLGVHEPSIVMIYRCDPVKRSLTPFPVDFGSVGFPGFQRLFPRGTPRPAFLHPSLGTGILTPGFR